MDILDNSYIIGNFDVADGDMSDFSDVSSSSDIVNMESNGENHDNDKPKRRKETQRRRRLSPDETRILCRIFEHNQKPNSGLRNQLAQQLGMSSRNIQIWFQNRRAKLKRDGSGDEHNIMMPKHMNIPEISYTMQKDAGVPILPAGFKMPPVYGMNILRSVPLVTPQIQLDTYMNSLNIRTAPPSIHSTPQMPNLDLHYNIHDIPEIVEPENEWNFSLFNESEQSLLSRVPSNISLTDSSSMLSRKHSFDELDINDEIMESSKRRKSCSDQEQNNLLTVNMMDEFADRRMSEPSALFEF